MITKCRGVVCRGQAVSMGSLRMQLVAPSSDGVVEQPLSLRHLDEQELWQTSLVGKQFPELDMLSPFVHDGAELSGWQPPELQQATRATRMDESCQMNIARGFVVLWLVLFCCVLS